MKTLYLNDEHLSHYGYEAIKLSLASGAVKMFRINNLNDFKKNFKHALCEVNKGWVKGEIFYIPSENENDWILYENIYNPELLVLNN